MIYLAGVPGGGWSIRERELNKLWNYRLWSYYYSVQEKNIMPQIKNKVDLFLDSGAFSAKSQGVKINIQEYISFIKENETYIDVYANLDVIGNPKATFNNQKRMERAGLHPLPVFHFGEDEELYLKPLIEKYDYIAIGGMVKSGDLMSFLDRIFSKYICDKKGMPKVKIHGFGLTSLKLIMRYPWYSVDSTSWVVTGRMGSIYIPRRKNGKWIYNENSWKIPVSNKSPSLKEAGQHFTTMRNSERQLIIDYLKEKGYKIGESKFKDKNQDYELQENEKWFEKKPQNKSDKRKVEIIVVPGVSNKYQLRDEINIIYFLDLEKSLPEWPWVYKSKVMKGFGL